MAVEYSFVIPVLNELETLEALHSAGPVMDKLDGTCEVVLVDDGSTDGSLAAMRRLHVRDARFQRRSPRRATSGIRSRSRPASIRRAAKPSSSWTPISRIRRRSPSELAKKWREGFDVVYASATERAASPR